MVTHSVFEGGIRLKLKIVLVVTVLMLMALFSSSGSSEVYVSGHDYSESDIRLTPHDLYVIPPYNITFNFSGMEEFKVDGYISGPRITTENDGDGTPRRSIWSYDTTSIYLETPDLKKSIDFAIRRYIANAASNPVGSGDTLYEKCKQHDADIKLGVVDASNERCLIKESENGIVTAYQFPGDLAQTNRPVPTNGNYHAEIILNTLNQSLVEIIQINFDNIPLTSIEQFIKSLRIKGTGKKETGKSESWEDYVARMRQPNDYNGYAPSISALKFIDILYDKMIYYDAKTGGLVKQNIELVPNTEKFIRATDQTPFNTTQIEVLAIKNHYWGPIPLPKNVSLSLPNGEQDQKTKA